MKRVHLVCAVAVLTVACGGSKTPAADSSMATPAPATVPVIQDSVKADTTVKPAADTAVKAAAPAKPAVAPGDHDVAKKPRFEVDEKTGETRVIKKP